MQIFNFIYESHDKLQSELEGFRNESNILLQIFYGSKDENFANDLIKFINSILPQAEIMFTTASGEISDGNHYESNILISASIFQATTIKTLSFKRKDLDSKKIALMIFEKLVKDNTKLLIIFGNTLAFDATSLLEEIAVLAPNLMITGGNAGESDLSFTKTFVGDKTGVDDFIIVCSALYSDVLKVYSDSIFEWNRIGIDMTITDSQEGGIVNTINNIPAREIYRKYLGDIVADSMPSSSFEFPLTFFEGDLLIGRAAIAVFQNGGLKYAGDIKKGTKVRFGVGSLISTKDKTILATNKLLKSSIEGIYIYSCIARYTYFRSTMIDFNISKFNNIATTCGFFTYGEFYHNENKNYILNVSNTFVALSEGLNPPKTNTIRDIKDDIGRNDLIAYGLINLVSVSNKDYIEMVNIFKQYKDLLEESSILLYMDTEGNIINANKLFFSISRYTKSQIIGKKISYMLKDNSPDLSKIIWKDITQGKTWLGILKHRAADSSIFYTKTIIKPIIDSSNNTLMYLCSMNDITEYELKKENLEHSINALTEISLEKDKEIEEYQILLDKSTAMVRIKQEYFVEVNKSCEEVFGYAPGELINKHISNVIDHSKAPLDLIDKARQVLATKGYLKTYLPCIDKFGNKVHIQAYLMAIKVSNVKKYDEEIVGILHNVTELFSIQQELEDVQKEVIYAMGTISEGRSRETGNHVKRVAEYSYLLAKLNGLDEEQSALLKIASPMHDIGKLAIPDAILNKPGKLTDEEFEIMKTHAQRGYDMLSFSDRSILKTSAQIALTHHEWWNGNGYPNKIKGEQIPLFGRITAVADVFDALSNDRCYKKAWPIDEVIEHMVKNKDIQFQASLIDLLVDNLEEFIKIKIEFQDKF